MNVFKQILVFPFPLLAHYIRCIRWVQEYYSHCEVKFHHHKCYRKFISKNGYSAFLSEHFDKDYVMQCIEKFNFSWLNLNDLERIFLSQLQVIARFKPDLVLGDSSPTLRMAAEKTGVKYHALMNGYMTRYYSDTRRISITHPAYQLSAKLPISVSNTITRFAESMASRKIHAPFKTLRKKYNLAPIQTYLEELEGHVNYICDDPDLFPQTHLPDSFKFTGPLLPKETNHEFDQKVTTNGKLNILVTLGSSGDWKTLKFLEDSIYSSFNILTAGDKKRILKAKHVFAKDFVDLEKTLSISRIMLCHGGNGTLYFGLRHNIPMLCFTRHFEQEWNVHALERIGKGRHANKMSLEEVRNWIFNSVHKK